MFRIFVGHHDEAYGNDHGTHNYPNNYKHINRYICFNDGLFNVVVCVVFLQSSKTTSDPDTSLQSLQTLWKVESMTVMNLIK